MKPIFILLLVVILSGCQYNNQEIEKLQNQIDQLEDNLSRTYKPGFGEFMGFIQGHHSKLWFAGINENWSLADFEIHELEEGFEAIEKYHAGRKETQLIATINPALDSVSAAIQEKNLEKFKRSYNYLTVSCTDCHIKTNHEFIKITIPTQPDYSNQVFN